MVLRSPRGDFGRPNSKKVTKAQAHYQPGKNSFTSVCPLKEPARKRRALRWPFQKERALNWVEQGLYNDRCRCPAMLSNHPFFHGVYIEQTSMVSTMLRPESDRFRVSNGLAFARSALLRPPAPFSLRHGVPGDRPPRHPSPGRRSPSATSTWMVRTRPVGPQPGNWCVADRSVQVLVQKVGLAEMHLQHRSVAEGRQAGRGISKKTKMNQKKHYSKKRKRTQTCRGKSNIPSTGGGSTKKHKCIKK